MWSSRTCELAHRADVGAGHSRSRSDPTTCADALWVKCASARTLTLTLSLALSPLTSPHGSGHPFPNKAVQSTCTPPLFQQSKRNEAILPSLVHPTPVARTAHTHAHTHTKPNVGSKQEFACWAHQCSNVSTQSSHLSRLTCVSVVGAGRVGGGNKMGTGAVH